MIDDSYLGRLNLQIGTYINHNLGEGGKKLTGAVNRHLNKYFLPFALSGLDAELFVLSKPSKTKMLLVMKLRFGKRKY